MTDKDDWRTMDSAPRGMQCPHGKGPKILALAVGEGWYAYKIVRWRWHKNGKTGAWRWDRGEWKPDFWKPLTPPPQAKEPNA